MPRVKNGDIFEIVTANGLAYAQYINKHRRYGALIRVFSTCERERPNDFGKVLKGEVQFLCFFPLQAAVNQEIVTILGRAPVPSEYQKFPVFRSGVADPKTGKVAVWWLWDGEREWRVDQLTEEQRSLPIRGVWNDTILIERIESGWTAESDSTT